VICLLQYSSVVVVVVGRLLVSYQAAKPTATRIYASVHAAETSFGGRSAFSRNLQTYPKLWRDAPSLGAQGKKRNIPLHFAKQIATG